MLIREGIHSAMAASAVVAGTWGSFSSISSMHIEMVSEMSYMTVSVLVMQTLTVSIASLIVCCAGCCSTQQGGARSKG